MTNSANTPIPHRRLPFRPDIEGLRAVAILLVVAAHANFPWFSGGFIGVDVFYVLSGYLITGLLLQEVRATQAIDFADFYARRFRRLMPGLLLMLVGTGIAAWLLVAPTDQPAQAIAAVSASVWLSNFHFAFSDLGYFTPGAETNLYLHTWSLGVEEQFYLIWPALLAIGLGVRKEGTHAAKYSRLRAILIAILAASLLACIVWTRTAPLLAFYMMPARAWQFALGALVFLHFGSRDTDTRPRDAPQTTPHLLTVGWLGLGSILAAALVLDAKTPYPGFWALLPSVGTAAVLAAGTRRGSAGVARLLAWGPMQSIGRISYAWYLWHWPVLLLGACVIRTDIAINRLGLVLLSLLIASASYRWVEAPLRRRKSLITRPRIAVAGAFACMIIAASIGLRWHNHAIDRLSDPDQQPFQAIRYDAPVIYTMPCDDWYQSADVRPCTFGPEDASHTAVILGDSVGVQWFPAFAEIFGKPDWRLLVLTKSSCPIVDAPFFYARIGRVFTECAKWRQDALQFVASLKPDIVILGSTSTYGFAESDWIEGTANVLRKIDDAAKRIVIMRSTPVLPFDGPSCLAPRSRLHTLLTGTNGCSASAHDGPSDDVFHWLALAAKKFPNAKVVDMTDSVCPAEVCRAELNGMVVFRDTQHLTAKFAASLSGVLQSRLGVPDLDESTPPRSP
jgi:peptidoglycan/LPS O-acetylase OafA/YrhL